MGGWDDEGMNGYELLNEVGSGGTLSSLFTILSLFTEDVKMSWDEDLRPQSPSRAHSRSRAREVRTRLKRADSDVSSLSLGHISDSDEEEGGGFDEDDDGAPTMSPSRRASMSSTNSTIHADSGPRIHSRTSSSARNVPGASTSTSRSRSRQPRPSASQARGQGQGQGHTRKERVLRGTVARATEDTTLAVIPAEAFRRLTKKFPKSSAHIVQGTFFRFSLLLLFLSSPYFFLVCFALPRLFVC